MDSDAGPDFHLRFPDLSQDGGPQAGTRLSAFRRNGLTLRYRENESYWRFSFADDGCCDIQIDPPHAPRVSVFMDPGRVAPYVDGLLSGWFLRRQHQTALHAGGVAFDGRVLLLVGGSSRGKSTTVAWLISRGARFVTDDIARVKEHGNGWQVYFGPPRVRLWPESAIAVGADPRGMCRVFPDTTKRFLDVGGGDNELTVPLAAIALLDANQPGSGPVVSASGKREALMELLGQIYAVDLPGCGPTGADFETLSGLVNDVPVFRLANGGGLADLPRTGRALEQLMRDLRG